VRKKQLKNEFRSMLIICLAVTLLVTVLTVFIISMVVSKNVESSIDKSLVAVLQKNNIELQKTNYLFYAQMPLAEYVVKSYYLFNNETINIDFIKSIRVFLNDMSRHLYGLTDQVDYFLVIDGQGQKLVEFQGMAESHISQLDNINNTEFYNLLTNKRSFYYQHNFKSKSRLYLSKKITLFLGKERNKINYYIVMRLKPIDIEAINLAFQIELNNIANNFPFYSLSLDSSYKLCVKTDNVELYGSQSCKLLGNSNFVQHSLHNSFTNLDFHILFSRKTFYLYQIKMVCTAIIMILLFMIAFFLFIKHKTNVIKHEFERIKTRVNSLLRESKFDKLIEFNEDHHYDDFNQLINAFNRLNSTSYKYREELLVRERDDVALRTARQVAHDIRSPLAALNMVTQDLKELPEDERIIIRSAVQRIQDIANDLSSKRHKVHGNELKVEDNNNLETKTKLLSSLVEQMISEKRTEYRSNAGMNIESKFNTTSYGLFAEINSREFKRIISNLINNSIEALEQKGNIIVSMISVQEAMIQITVTDDGKGIPEEVLPKLMEKGASFGKEKHKKSGSGLGLYHAKETIESWGGDVRIESSLGDGTIVTITLPRQPAPDWFVPELSIDNNTYVFVLDDDDSIHQVWQNRFNKLQIAKDKVHHFKSDNSILAFYREKEFLLKKAKTLFLFDYELLGNEKTGLQVINELNIKENAILVTSHYEEEHIRNECARLGVKLLPKNLAGFVPILVMGDRLSVIEKDEKTINEKPCDMRRETRDVKCDAVLIDDDALVHATWKMIGKQYGKVVKCYVEPDEFIEDIDQYSKETPLYIDSNLSYRVKGEILAKEIYDKGFKNIYLATGYSKEDFGDMFWIKEVVGKQPPFAQH
jgi:signal transduction histidine kinase